MRKWTIPSVLLLLCLLSLLPDQGRKLQANAEADSDELVDPPKVEEKIGAVPSGLSTDSDVAKREAESISKRSQRSNAQHFEFQAEVSRLMDIIIHSLYSNKDIFLRELISNASDALDKIRFLALTDKDVLGEGDDTNLEIQIKLDKEKRIISIRDRGIGMTKEDLIKNLGTIAKSGTSAFVEKMQTSGDLNLIGQFGVGFYSVYLVADNVEVISKHNDDKQHIWESKADGSFVVAEDTENEPLGRGTEIRLHLREEAGEYLEESKLKELVKKYSEFINFPIRLWASKEVDVEVPADEDESNDEEESSETEKSEEETEKGEDEDEDAEKKPKTKTKKETTYEWELLNDVKAIWLRSPKEVTDEEYTKFYHSLAKDFGDEKPLSWSHFTAEGDVEFKAVLFVPPKAPHDLYESYYNANKSNLKLYVRRVFISDEFDELLPKYLNFLLGLVDSDTLPLNVSREMLQQHSSLKTIKKKLIRKALDMIRKLAEEDPDESSDKDNKEVEKSEDDEKRGQYTRFWNEFGKSIKLGIIEDAANRNRLAKLLRFESTKSDGKLTSLDQYISRMKSGQKDIFYITGASKEQLEKSPFLERLKKKNFEVIFFTDPVDEYLMQYLMDYEDKKFQNVSAVPPNSGTDDKTETNATAAKQELHKSVQDRVQAVQSLESDNVDQVSAPSSTNDYNFRKRVTLEPIKPVDSQSSTSFTMLDSPNLSEKSSSRLPLTLSPSPVLALTSWLGSGGYNESKSPSVATPSIDSSVTTTEFDPSSDLKSPGPSTASTFFSASPKLLLEMDECGYGGGPCSAGATAVLDFIAEVLSEFVTEQIKVSQIIEGILESVPLYVDADSMLVFQGLCLSRLMNFLERRLLRDDEENEKKLDKNRWSSNLDSLCWMIVDRAYMGAFPQPSGILKTLEFLLSMLQLANKDGRIEEATPSGKSLLSIGRGSRQLDAYLHSILKNTNRMILYCFLPSFLSSIGEDDLLLCLGLLVESKKRVSSNSSLDNSGIDICTVLQLLVAHRRIIFCPSNMDTDINCCLCVNLISLLFDQRQNVQNLAVDIVKYLLVHRRVALEDLLVSKPNQGHQLDVLHGGFDKLLTENLSAFFEWLQSSELMVNKVLEQCASIMWVQYITGSAKFPGVRIKAMEGRRKREMGRKSRDASKLDVKHWEQVNERRYALELVRDAMSTELRVVRQDKYGWVLHAESEWQTHLQQLVHERGIFPMRKSSVNQDPDWQLCPIEGPYRMRKKLERCRLKLDTIQNVLDGQFEVGKAELSKEKNENDLNASDNDSEPFFQLLTDSAKQNGLDGELYDGSFFKKPDNAKDVASARTEWNDDRASSLNEASLHSALEFGGKSSSASVPNDDSVQERSDLGSPWQSSSARIDDVKVTDDKSDKELHDNGEYLIRPYLEPFEKIRFRYNCERVMGLDKHDGIFLIGELSLYVIENFYIDDSGCICEKECKDELSIIDQALGVKKDVNLDFQSKSTSSWGATEKSGVGGRAWAYNGGAWGKEKVCTSGSLPHPWNMWKLNSVHELLKRDYQLRPVAVEIFSMDGCNDLLVFHKKEREEVFRNLVAMNLPRNSMLDTTISGSAKQESNEGSRLFKSMAKSFSKRWQNGEISNFQYLMHLNTLAGRGYSDLTQYPVFPWVLSDYESENLDLLDPKTFRGLDKPMGCQTLEGEEEFRKRYESWDDPEVPKFHYGSHYSSAGIVLFYLLRLPPFSAENQKLQGGQFDHADRLFNSIRDTWFSAAGKGNTSDVKELIPEFFYMPEFLENRFNLDLGEKQSGEKVGDVGLPPWAKGSAREFIRKHREALESDYVSQNLHHWIDLIFGYKQRGKAAEEAVNVFYHYTYEGSVDIDSVTDPAMKASILAQINHFGQTPKQLFLKPHVERQVNRRVPHPLKYSNHLVQHEIRKTSSSITQIVTVNEKILVAGTNCLLKPRTYTKYVAWGFPDRSLRFMNYDQDRLLSTHENLHGGNQIQCTGVSHDGQILVTGADDGLVSVWRISNYGPRVLRRLQLEKALCAHTSKITCLHVSQPYMLIVSGSDDCTVVVWDLSSLVFVRQLPEFPAPISAIYVNDLTGEIVTAAGILLAVWSVNGDCLAMVNTSQLPSDSILSVTSSSFSDWLDTNWFVTGHQSGAVKVWQMVHHTNLESSQQKSTSNGLGGLNLNDKAPEYRLVLHKVLKFHKHPVTALLLTNDLKQLLSGDSGGHLLSWTVPDESLRGSMNQG